MRQYSPIVKVTLFFTNSEEIARFNRLRIYRRARIYKNWTHNGCSYESMQYTRLPGDKPKLPALYTGMETKNVARNYRKCNANIALEKLLETKMPDDFTTKAHAFHIPNVQWSDITRDARGSARAAPDNYYSNCSSLIIILALLRRRKYTMFTCTLHMNVLDLSSARITRPPSPFGS